VRESLFLSPFQVFFMRELLLYVEDDKYEEFIRFLKTIDYIKIISDCKTTLAHDSDTTTDSAKEVQ
jgi:hypothetical protein